MELSTSNIFQEMELFRPRLKNENIHPEKTSYISKSGNPEKKIYIFSEELFIFQQTKLSYISGNRTSKASKTKTSISKTSYE